jgi:hypothetical protein
LRCVSKEGEGSNRNGRELKLELEYLDYYSVVVTRDMLLRRKKWSKLRVSRNLYETILLSTTRMSSNKTRRWKFKQSKRRRRKKKTYKYNLPFSRTNVGG